MEDSQSIICDLIKSHFPSSDFQTIFDVGAFDGRSAKVFREAWPESSVYCFEPGSQQLNKLLQFAESDELCSVEPIILSDRKRRLYFSSTGSSGDRIEPRYYNFLRLIFNFAVKLKLVSGKSRKILNLVSITSRTGDIFCQERNVTKINFLKIDTEGHDLKVLMGFRKLIRMQMIDVFQVEAGVNNQRKHVSLCRFIDFAKKNNYKPFGLFEQTLESDRPELRRVNAVFISQRMSSQNHVNGSSPRALFN